MESQKRYSQILQIPEEELPSPCFLMSEALLEKNLEACKYIKEKTGCKILLAQKGFAMWSFYPLIREYLDGVATSSPWEAQLGFEAFGKEVHGYAAAFSKDDLKEFLKYSSRMVFNSFSLWKKYRDTLPKEKDYALRMNPGYAEVETNLYNPCIQGSRLGIAKEEFEAEELEGISGLHFHALCMQGADVLQRVLQHAEKDFGEYFYQMKEINFGGGHWLSSDGYDKELLISEINRIQEKYDVQVYLEPGGAIGYEMGVLTGTVLDIVKNGVEIALLDISAECHMPDVLAMPYRAEIIGAGKPDEYAHTYRLGGLSCLAGDIIGDYSFSKPLQIGQKLIFTDMGHYTMVKTTMFNGIQHPSIGILRKNGNMEIVREFSYEDYKNRLS